MTIMDLFQRSDLRDLLAEHERPCLSLYMPTHRGGSEEDPIRFRKLITAAEERLTASGLSAPEARTFLEPLQSLLKDEFFWRHQSDGLAVFLSRDLQRVFRLPCPFQEELQVGGLFLVSPLLPLLQGDGRFFVLALSQNGVRLFQGTRFTISPIDLRGVPQTLAEALATHDRDEILTFHGRPTSGRGWGAIFHGHGVGIDDEKNDLLRFFQKIDRALHTVLREEHAPLVLAAVDYLQPIYREANTYPGLVANGLDGSPDHLGEAALHDRAWKIVEPGFREHIQQACSRYHEAAAAGKATADLSKVVMAAYRGELETLFVALDQHRWGVVDPARGEVTLHEESQPGDGDLSNFAAIHTLRHGHVVYALPADKLPVRSCLAGIFHLPKPPHSGRQP